MKLTKYVLSLGILTAATAPYALTTTEASAATKTISGVVSKDVIVRASSTPKSKNLGTLTKGTNVTIYKETKYWYQVKFNNKLSYISKDHVKVAKKKATTTKKTTATKASTKVISTIKTKKAINASIKSNVYFYEKASKTSKQLGILKKGTKIHVNNTAKSGWVEFDNNGKKNYVYVDFVVKNAAKKATTTKTTTTKTTTNTATTAKKVTTTPAMVTTVKSAKKANAKIKSSVYFFENASTKKQLGTLKTGTKIHVNKVHNYGWVEFDNNGKKNFINIDFVTFDK